MYRQRAAFANHLGTDRFVVVDLPMPLGHEVLAGEYRLAIENADAPVVLGVEKLLSQQQYRVLEQLGRRRVHFLGRADLDHTSGKAAVGNLQYQRKAQPCGHVLQFFGAVLVENFRSRHAQIMAFEQVGQVHLVGAAQDRGGVIHDHQPLAFGFLGKAIGVVVDAGGFANQQRVVFGQAGVVFLFDQLDIDAQALTDADEIGQRLRVGRRQLFLRVMQNRQVVAGHAPRTRLAPDVAAEAFQRRGELILLILTQAR